MDNNDLLLNGSQATYVMPLTQGEVLGSYSGTFVFSCYLTPIQQLEAGREYRSLLGSHGPMSSETEANIAFALSQLKYRVISAPPFWNSTKQGSGYAGDIPDLNILALILEKAIMAENLFKESIQKERDALLERTILAGEAALKKEE
jgi:hypothetical protein